MFLVFADNVCARLLVASLVFTEYSVGPIAVLSRPHDSESGLLSIGGDKSGGAEEDDGERGGLVGRSVTVDRLTEDGFCVWLVQSLAGGSGGGKASDGHANYVGSAKKGVKANYKQ